MARTVKTIGVLISGGDAPGMNAAIRAVVRAAINKDLKVKGIMRGYAGLLEEEIVDMESTSVPNIINRDGIILYTTRCKEFTTAEGQQKGVDVHRKHDIGEMVIIGEDGSFRGAGKPSSLGIDTISLPGTIDLNIVCTNYIISFDMTVSTAMEAIDKIRDTPTSYEWCSIVEVMGRNAGYIVLWCGTRNGAEDVLLPERYDGNGQALINRTIDSRGQGRRHNVIINAEGIGHSGSMAEHIETAMGIEARATILGHMQRDGAPACKDRVHISIMGAKAAELLTVGKSDRLVAHKHDESVDFDTQEALSMTKDVPERQYEITKMPIRQSGT